jgi:cysteinyl-tRNA synthetase
MTEITLYNTRTRQKDRLAPIDPENVRMYVCGPTVYDRAHIGNARPVVVFDTLFRLLRHVYGESHVTYVRNFTDVDDKINKRAADTLAPGETELEAIRRITDETIGWYHGDMDALGALRPSIEPRATEFIGPMVAMIATLIEKGHAYAAEGHALFSVSSYPEYGAFAKRSLDEMRAGSRVEVAPYKRDPMDFVLWKPSTPDQPGWESPWGRGRPGWHIECSAMSYELLGDSFDIHGGGIDLVFPHHENEIAQSCCAHPEGHFANIWMHNGFVNVEGEKMSKSLGNFFTVRDLLDLGVPQQAIRFVLLSTHYRQPMDWTKKSWTDARATLEHWTALTAGVTPSASIPLILAELADDLNTPGAIAAMHDAANSGRVEELAGAMLLLGVDKLIVTTKAEIGERIGAVLEARDMARSAKDFARSDALRSFLQVAGVVVSDGGDIAWKQGYNDDVFGWLTLARLAEDRKIHIGLENVLEIAAKRGAILEKVSGKKGMHWRAGTTGNSTIIDEYLLSLAEAEARL